MVNITRRTFFKGEGVNPLRLIPLGAKPVGIIPMMGVRMGGILVGATAVASMVGIGLATMGAPALLGGIASAASWTLESSALTAVANFFFVDKALGLFGAGGTEEVFKSVGEGFSGFLGGTSTAITGAEATATTAAVAAGGMSAAIMPLMSLGLAVVGTVAAARFASKGMKWWIKGTDSFLHEPATPAPAK